VVNHAAVKSNIEQQRQRHVQTNRLVKRHYNFVNTRAGATSGEGKQKVSKTAHQSPEKPLSLMPSQHTRHVSIYSPTWGQ
jgi:hypothetical protein